MSLVIDYILGDALMHSHPLDSVSSDPASASEGSIILNTTDHTIKIYYSGSWQTLHTLTAAGTIEAGNPMGLLLTITYPATP